MSGETAIRILEDCHRAIQLLETTDDPQLRRILWVSSIALLRTIGDALDRDPDEGIKSAYRSAMQRWKAESKSTNKNIFFDFIKKERDNVIHEYEFGHTDDALVFLLDGANTAPDLSPSSDMSDVYWPMSSGMFEGEDARDALVAAVEWWDREVAAMVAV